MIMNSVISNQLLKLFRDGKFPNKHNEIWTMCQVILKMAIGVVEEAEKHNMVDKQFFIEFENAINQLSCRDHSLYMTNDNPEKKEEDIKDFADTINKFYADPE